MSRQGRKHFTPEFRLEVAQLVVDKNYSVRDAAENRKLKQEVDLLKKWQRFLAEEHQQGIDSSKDSD